VAEIGTAFIGADVTRWGRNDPQNAESLRSPVPRCPYLIQLRIQSTNMTLVAAVLKVDEIN